MENENQMYKYCSSSKAHGTDMDRVDLSSRHSHNTQIWWIICEGPVLMKDATHCIGQEQRKKCTDWMRWAKQHHSQTIRIPLSPKIIKLWSLQERQTCATCSLDLFNSIYPNLNRSPDLTDPFIPLCNSCLLAASLVMTFHNVWDCSTAQHPTHRADIPPCLKSAPAFSSRKSTASCQPRTWCELLPPTDVHTQHSKPFSQHPHNHPQVFPSRALFHLTATEDIFWSPQETQSHWNILIVKYSSLSHAWAPKFCPLAL